MPGKTFTSRQPKSADTPFKVLGFRVLGVLGVLGFRVYSLGGFGFRVLGFGVLGVLGFRV